VTGNSADFKLFERDLKVASENVERRPDSRELHTWGGGNTENAHDVK